MRHYMKNIHKQKIRECFNKSYATYDKYSNIQKMSGKKLIDALIRHTHVSCFCIDHVIDLGCGTGFVTEQLAGTFQYKHFYAIDISDKLLSISKDRLKFYNINIDNMDFEIFHFKDILFDLIFSNMALHWSLNINKTLSNIYHNLNHNGVLAFSLPVKGTFSELTYHAKNKFYTEEQIKQYLTSTKFKIITYFSEKIILEFDSAIHALKSIKAVGANYVFNADQPRHIFRYPKKSNNKFYLTYHIAYFIAGKK